MYCTYHFKIVFVKISKSFFDRELAFNNGFITDAQSTPPLRAAIFLVLLRWFSLVRTTNLTLLIKKRPSSFLVAYSIIGHTFSYLVVLV